jgi:hypothetical protein
MRLFTCPHCSQVLYFENTRCERCGFSIGYAPDAFAMLARESESGGDWIPAQEGLRRCENAQYDACNWVLAEDDPGPFCLACSHNRTVPDLSVPDNVVDWRRLEAAKRRLFYAITRFGLPHPTRAEDPEHGLCFDFLADAPAAPKVLTGHDNGVITIALREADDAERTKLREQMGELYRTPLGHFRHEIGHYYWDVLVRDGGKLDECREIFGDDRADYNEALKAHYARPAPAGWQDTYVSVYASSHPWEDFAETWAHYLHIVDTLEMAAAFGISVNAQVTRDPILHADMRFDPYRANNIETLMEAWLPLCFAVNSLNRSMGQTDLYPFIISPAVAAKLDFVRRLVGGWSEQVATPPDVAEPVQA